MEDKMTLFNRLKSVPNEFTRPITGVPGLKGFTDINPMWRLMKLTEEFGPCGQGWYIDNVRHWTEEKGNNVAAFCELHLFVKFPGATEWSAPIYGIGGSTLTGGRCGSGMSDEAAKMAYTDAISVACKALGMAADVYLDKNKQTKENRDKYDAPLTDSPTPAPAPAPAYKPLSPEGYWNTVAAHAEGKKTDKGENIRSWWINKCHPDKTTISKFDDDVINYKISNSIQ